jgi:hypothetical protein
MGAQENFDSVTQCRVAATGLQQEGGALSGRLFQSPMEKHLFVHQTPPRSLARLCA